jgi:hypothetical protein
MRRKYTNGSVLRMHVDTVNTHVVSAIINVDQSVEKDWPLLILDHEVCPVVLTLVEVTVFPHAEYCSVPRRSE